jgi:hypothetical protein
MKFYFDWTPKYRPVTYHQYKRVCLIPVEIVYCSVIQHTSISLTVMFTACYNYYWASKIIGH